MSENRPASAVDPRARGRPRSRRWSGIVSDLALPRFCVGCQRRGTHWCAECVRGARGRAPPHLATELLAGSAVGPGLPIATASDYAGQVREALLAFKASGSRELAAELGQWLGRALASIANEAAALGDGRPLVVVPVPASRASLLRRWGVDCVDCLVWNAVRGNGGRSPGVPGIAPGTSLIVQRHGLRVRGWGSGQKGRSAGARRSARLAFEVTVSARAQLVGAPVIIVDDVITTGATVHAAAAALIEARARPVGAAAVARTRLRSPPTGGAA